MKKAKTKATFTKLDLHVLIISERPRSPAAALAYVKKRGSMDMQHCGACSQRLLAEWRDVFDDVCRNARVCEGKEDEDDAADNNVGQ